MRLILTVLAVLILVGVGAMFIGSRTTTASSDEAARSESSRATEERAVSELEAAPVATEVTGNDEAGRAAVIAASSDESQDIALSEGATTEAGDVDGAEAGDRWTLRMRLLDSAGAPIESKNVELRFGHGMDGEVERVRGSIEADEDGRVAAEIDEPPPDLQWLDVQAEPAHARVEFPAEFGEREIDFGDIVLREPIELHPEPVLSGRILDELGGAIANVSGELRAANPEDLDPDDPDPLGQVVIDDDGYFRGYLEPGVDSCLLIMSAAGFDGEFRFIQDLPQHDLEIVLFGERRLRGTLVVPAGLNPEDFGVWMAQDGSALGLSPDEDGSFIAMGSTKSMTFEVTYPSLGFKLHKLELDPLTLDDGKIGEIDLRPHVRVVRLSVLDPAGKPRVGQDVSVEPVEGDSKTIETDELGLLTIVIPNDVLEVELSVEDGRSVELDLLSPPGEVTL